MYQIIDKKAIFNCDFDQELNGSILNDISQCDTVIFSNYEDLNICLRTNFYFAKYYYSWKGSKFNQEIDNLPSSIINLTLGYYFNQEINNLPSSIINLTLGNSFNQEINNLPSSIINLTLGNSFNQEINNLPDSICKIAFRTECNYYPKFNQEIKKIPKNLKIVDLSRMPKGSFVKKNWKNLMSKLPDNHSIELFL
jgi:hypothetical protein